MCPCQIVHYMCAPSVTKTFLQVWEAVDFPKYFILPHLYASADGNYLSMHICRIHLCSAWLVFTLFDLFLSFLHKSTALTLTAALFLLKVIKSWCYILNLMVSHAPASKLAGRSNYAWYFTHACNARRSMRTMHESRPSELLQESS
jgi:hypothetical protein